ncbi:MAG: pyruvate dehydrogenase (acetyl-transferring) E1 component subunit alpha [Gammaproteobacteria bacterium]
MKNITAQFAINFNRYLDAEGNPTQTLPDFANNHDELLAMYRWMVLVRTFDTKAVNLQRTGKMGTYAGILGQEAVSVGIGQAMQKSDVLCPAYREYGAYLQRGVKMSDIFSYWGGDERGSHFASPDFPICVPIATQCLHAVGIGFAFKYRKQPHVAVAVLGDGGTSKGDFYEAMNLAGEWKLPVVFVINNNQWAISLSRQEQTATQTLAQKAIAAGFEGLQVDGNDIIAVREAVEKAFAKARAGEGPTLIEAITYRLCDHTTADDAKRYRPSEEVEKAWQEEPLIRLRKYLQNAGVLTAEQDEAITAECQAEVEQAVNEYTKKTPQPPESIFDYHYETLPESLIEQRNELLENLSS